ncbi:MAG: acyl-ACP--UDP-N-acetylglucosamine O-acyltransferase [Lentisphaeria bacterium]|jgi:UDP-N-acetylglucosamine acyltransferase
MIHPTAIVMPGAVLGADVEIGPYAVVDGEVTLGDRVRVGPHVHLTGRTVIGAGTRIHASAVLGGEPQDYHYQGWPTQTRIGANCIIREFVTVHRSAVEGGSTVVGDGCMLMATAHVAHDCQVGNQVVIANSALLAGHITVGDKAFISGNVSIHQFCRIGTLAMIGGGSGVGKDVPPYCLYQYGAVRGLNAVGLRRGGFDAATRLALKRAWKLFFLSGLSRPNALEALREEAAANPAVALFRDFLVTTKRGIAPGPRDALDAAEE